MQVDCDRCAVRGPACSGCVVTFLLGLPEGPALRRAGADPGVSARGGVRADVDPDLTAVSGVARVDRCDPDFSAVIGSGVVSFDESERRALDVLAGSGLVPPLRLVTAVDHPSVERFRAG